MRQRAREVLESANLLGEGILVALSGGRDSVCLLHILAEIAASSGGRIEVAHVDHGLRAESAADADFCRDLADSFSVRFHAQRPAPGTFAKRHDVQSRARALRRRFFEAILNRRGLSAVALGHHADDQVETVLYRLIRGGGLRGVAGMSPWARPYVRPLLGVRRATIAALVDREQWPYREDPTNLQVQYARNRVRHHALPLLRSIHPGCDEALLRFARFARQDDDYLSRRARRRLETLVRREPDGLRIPVAALGRQAASIRHRIYLAAWERTGCNPASLQCHHLEKVDALLEPGRPHRLAPIPGPGVFARSYSDLWVLLPGVLEPPRVEASLEAPGRALLRPLGVEAVWAAAFDPTLPGVTVPEGRGKGGLWVRTWRPGDRVDPGTGRPKKVKDLLMEARIPTWRRARALVVGDAKGAFGLVLPDRSWGIKKPGAGRFWVEECNGGSDGEID